MKKISLLVAGALVCILGVILGWRYFSEPAPTPAPPGAASAPPTVDIGALRTKAEAGEPAAQAQLATCYARGQSVPRNYAEAAKWFRMAAEKGDAAGQFGLGELYEAGQGGISRDVAEALRLYRLAAAQGHAGAQYNLGFMYEAGRGVAQDHVAAAKWYLLAAQQGEALAQYDLGQRYDLGVGVPVDHVEALKWLELAAAQGQTDAAARRDRVKQAMSRSEIQEAQRRVSAFAVQKK